MTYRTKEGELDILTPNHLIRPGKKFPSLVLSEQNSKMIWDVGTEEFREDLLSSLEARDALQARFIEIWKTDYLLSLREAHKNSQVSPKAHPYLKVGSIVLLKNPFKARVFWTLVRIIEIMPSHDGQIRAVRIQRSDRTETLAAVCNLYPLELETIEVPFRESLADEPNEQEFTEDINSEEWTDENEDTGPFLLEDIDIEENIDLNQAQARHEKDDSNRNTVVQLAPSMEKISGNSLRPRRRAADECNYKMKLISQMEAKPIK